MSSTTPEALRVFDLICVEATERGRYPAVFTELHLPIPRRELGGSRLVDVNHRSSRDGIGSLRGADAVVRKAGSRTPNPRFVYARA